MANIYRYAISLFIFVCSAGFASATHLSGGDITYEYVQDSVYDFYFRYYRDCRGVPFSNPSSTTNLYCTSTNKKQRISLSLVSITDITTLCGTQSKPCNPKNTRGTGAGIEEHLYKSRIDFRQSIYNSFFSCGDLIVETGQCCRNGAITNGIQGVFYTYLLFNPQKAIKNSSPYFSSTPRMLTCCNQPVNLDMGAVDKDGDSLSYAMETPLNGWNNKASFSSKFSATKPVTPYDPTGRGVVNPNANPPIGFYLDASSGLIIYTPTKCDEVAVMLLQVKEWRKDSSGKYQLIGITHRDVQASVVTCSDNNSPTIKGPYSYSVCAGDSITFKVSTDDKVYVPPPPLPTPDPDSVKLSWVDPNFGVKIRIENDTVRLQKAIVSWKPKPNQARQIPYKFVLKATDSHCPYPGQAVRAFEITVLRKPDFTIVRKELSCGVYEVTTKSSLSDTLKPTWSLKDSAGNLRTDANFYFKSSNSTVSIATTDTLVMKKAGPVNLSAKAQYSKCATEVIDKFQASEQFDLNLRDTLWCWGTIFKIGLDSIPNSKIAKHEWQLGKRVVAKDIYQGAKNWGTEVLTLKATDNSGCVHYDTMELTAKYKPQVSPLSDTLHCGTRTLRFKAIDLKDSGLVQNEYLWSNGVTTSELLTDSTNNYSVTVTNSCGESIESFKLDFRDPYLINLGKDIAVCDSGNIFLGDSTPVDYTNYMWSTGETSSFINVNTDGNYSIEVSNECYTITDNIIIELDTTPSLNFPDDIFYCDTVIDTYDAGNPGSTYKWDDGSKSRTKTISRAGWHYVEVSSKYCGSATDSTYADLALSPVVDLGPDTTVKKPFKIKLDAGAQSAVYTWSNGATTSSIEVDDFGTYWVELKSPCDTVSDTIAINQSVGIPGTLLEGLSILPNPNKGTFTIEGYSGIISEIQILNNIGQDISSFIVRQSKSIQVKVENYSPGVHILRLKSEMGWSSYQILLE